MIATLGRTATGYTVANEKKYDVWGAVRTSQSPGSHVVNPNKEYCANLGHTFDGESDLIYMRARYYEPATGRFISEDPAYDGHNWYTYCNGNPVSKVDFGGTEDELDGELLVWKNKLRLLSSHYMVAALLVFVAFVVCVSVKSEAGRKAAHSLVFLSIGVMLSGLISAAEFSDAWGPLTGVLASIAILIFENGVKLTNFYTQVIAVLWMTHAYAIIAAMWAITEIE